MPLWIYMWFVSTSNYLDIGNGLSSSTFFYGLVSVMWKTLLFHQIKCDYYKMDIRAHFSKSFSKNS